MLFQALTAAEEEAAALKAAKEEAAALEAAEEREALKAGEESPVVKPQHRCPLA